jgi:tetratricopeptide (TPR) repeat protein
MAYNFYFTFSQIDRFNGNFENARESLQQCLSYLPQIKSKRNDAMIYSELAHVERQAGRWQKALEGYQDTILRWKDLGHHPAVANQLECFAFIARVQDQPQRAARLLGAAEALREACGAPMTDYERAEYNSEIAALHRQLDQPNFESEWAAGRQMKLDQAIEYAIG